LKIHPFLERPLHTESGDMLKKFLQLIFQKLEDETCENGNRPLEAEQRVIDMETAKEPSCEKSEGTFTYLIFYVEFISDAFSAI
jgi:hypothetical protein